MPTLPKFRASFLYPTICVNVEFIYTNEEDVLLGVRNEIESLHLDVDLTLHRGEGRPLHTSRRPESELPPRDRTDTYPYP